MAQQSELVETAKPVIPNRLIGPLILGVAALLLTAFFAYTLASRQSFGPGEHSPEVGFARDMVTHHAQAVEMALLIRDRSQDEEMRQIALDMLLTQQNQIGQIQGWLNAWGYPLAGAEPAMTWMDMPVSGAMPGMATPEQMNRLRNLKGEEADGLFLQLMIVHHRSGVVMAMAALNRVEDPAVRSLAQSIVNGQTYEIGLMEELLVQKGFPLPDDHLHFHADEH